MAKSKYFITTQTFKLNVMLKPKANFNNTKFERYFIGFDITTKKRKKEYDGFYYANEILDFNPD